MLESLNLVVRDFVPVDVANCLMQPVTLELRMLPEEELRLNRQSRLGRQNILHEDLGLYKTAQLNRSRDQDSSSTVLQLDKVSAGA